MPGSLRYRLLAIAACATLAGIGALYAIVHLVRDGREQRLTRAREIVTRQVERLREASDAGRPIPVARLMRIGLRAQSGYLDATFNDPDGRRDLGPVAGPVVIRTARRAAARRGLVQDEMLLNTVTLVVAVAPIARGGYVWASTRVPSPANERAWRIGLGVLGVAIAMLIATAVHTIVAFDRGATTLRRALRALTDDLGAPVEAGSLRELRDVAGGIRAMARGLARARDDRDRLARELHDRERLASLGRVTAGVAHEVRNPLTAIKLRVDLLQQTPGVAPAVAADLGEVSQEVARLDRLVTDLLVIAGRRAGERAATDLGALAGRRVSMLAPWAAQRDVGVEVAGAGTLRVDADSVARAIDNLVRNAVEASPPGAAVRVTVAPRGSGCAIEVVDRGDGIPADAAARLFEPFFSTKSEGTGLGLALSRAIATAHGGELVYDRDGDRTRFTLTLYDAAPAA
jgi:signal transduction histidine kinase